MMSQFPVDAAMASKLNALATPVDLVDPTGRVIGRFWPKVDLNGWEPTEPFLTAEELEQRLNSGSKRYTTAEVLARLEKL